MSNWVGIPTRGTGWGDGCTNPICSDNGRGGRIGKVDNEVKSDDGGRKKRLEAMTSAWAAEVDCNCLASCSRVTRFVAHNSVHFNRAMSSNFNFQPPIVLSVDYTGSPRPAVHQHPDHFTVYPSPSRCRPTLLQSLQSIPDALHVNIKGHLAFKQARCSHSFS